MSDEEGYQIPASQLRVQRRLSKIISVKMAQDAINRRQTRVSLDLEDSKASHSSQETEKDVFFPLRGAKARPGDIDFAELDDFLRLTTKKKIQSLVMASGSSRTGDISQNALRYTPRNTEVKNEPLLEPDDATPSEKAKESDKEATAEHLWLQSSEERPLPGSPELVSASNDRFSYFHSLSEETVHAPDLALLIQGPSATFFSHGEGTWWLDCTSPTEDEVHVLAKVFGLHPLTAEDIRMSEPREKVEMFHSYYFISFHTFDADVESQQYLEPVHMYVVVFRAGVVTFHTSPTGVAANVRRRIRQLRDYVDVSPDWICYALIDAVTDGFAPVITAIEHEADAIDNSVFITRLTDFGSMLKRIGQCRHTVMGLMKLLANKADVIKMFAKRCQEHADGRVISPRSDIALYLGDIQDHIVTMYQSLSAYEKIFSRSQANYLAQLQVESFDLNLLTSEMLENLTILGTLLIPINVVTGIFGTNVLIPGNNDNSLWWFFGIIIFVLVFLVIMFVLIKYYTHKDAQVQQQDFDDSIVRSIKSAELRKKNRTRSVVSFPGRYEV